MKKLRKHICILALLFMSLIWGQDIQISYVNPTTVEICGDEVTYEVTIINNSGATLDANSSIELKLPDGIEYVNATVSSNFNDNSVTDNNHPIFTANESVANNSQLILQFNGAARCGAYSIIDDNVEIINNKIKYSYAIGGVTQPEVFINNATVFDESVTDSYNMSFRDINILIQPEISGQQNQTLTFNNTYETLQQQVDVSIRDHSLTFSEFSINITPDSELEFNGVSEIIIDGIQYNSSGVTSTGTNPIEVTFDAESIGVDNFTALMNIVVVFDYQARSCFTGNSQHVVYESVIHCIDGSSCSRGSVNGDFEFQQLDSNVSLDFEILDNQLNLCGDKASVSLTIENDVNAPSPIYNVHLFLFENLGANISNVVIAGVSVVENDYISTGTPGVLLQQSTFPNLQDLDGNGTVDLAPGNSITVTCDVEMTLPPELSDIQNCQSKYNSRYFDSRFYYNRSECDTPNNTVTVPNVVTFLEWTDTPNNTPVLDLEADIEDDEPTQVQFCIDRTGDGRNNLLYDDGIMLSAQVEIPCGIQIDVSSITFTGIDGVSISNEFIDVQTSVINERTIADIILLQPYQNTEGNYGGCFNFNIQLDCDNASNCSNPDQSLTAIAYGNFPECPDLKMNLGCATKNLIPHCLPVIPGCPSPLALVATDFVVTRTTYGTTEDGTQITIDGVDNGTFTGLNTKGAYACDTIRTEITGITLCELTNETLYAYIWYDHPTDFPFLTPTGVTYDINGVTAGTTPGVTLRPDLSTPTRTVFEIQITDATISTTDTLKVRTLYTVNQSINNTRLDSPNTIPDFPHVFPVSEFRGELKLDPIAANGGTPAPSPYNHGDDFEVYGLNYSPSFTGSPASCSINGVFRIGLNIYGGTTGDDFPNEFRDVIQIAGPVDVSVPSGVSLYAIQYAGHVPPYIFLSAQDQGGGVFRIIDSDFGSENDFRPFDKVSNPTYFRIDMRLALNDCSIEPGQEISANASYIEQAYVDGACRNVMAINPSSNPIIATNGSGFDTGDLNLDIVNPIFQSIEAVTRFKINVNNTSNKIAYRPWIKFTFPNNLINVENAPVPYGYNIVGDPLIDSGSTTTTLLLRLSQINVGATMEGHIDVALLDCEASGQLAEIQVETGISCVDIPDNILQDTSTLCTLDTNKKVELEIVKSDLLMEVIPLFDPNVPVENCEAFQYIVQISNNELANITNPTFQIDLPTGISMSAQYRYPITEIINTAADFSNTGFSSPVTITNGIPWALEGTNEILPGYGGNTEEYNNYYQLLITLTPNCDYNGVDKIRFTTNGVTNCNEAANVPSFETTPNIAGLEMLDDYSPELTIVVNQNGACGNYIANINYNSDTTISEDAVLTISLPSELSSLDPLTFDLPVTGTADFTFNFTAAETYCADTSFNYSISVNTALTCGTEECTSNLIIDDVLMTNVCCTGNCEIIPSMTIINGSEDDCETVACNIIVGVNTSTVGNVNTVINEVVWNVYDVNDPTTSIHTETGTLGHEFEDGTYIVCMTVIGEDTENNVTCEETICETVSINCNTCSASVEASFFPHSAYDGNCLTFDLIANNVTITYGTFVNYEWVVSDENGNQVASFTDTIEPTSQEVTVPTGGNYTAILTINAVNTLGEPCSTSQEISFSTSCKQCGVISDFNVLHPRTRPCNSPLIEPNTSIVIGTYQSYKWTVTDSNGDLIHMEGYDTAPQELDFVFPSSGDYTVCLEVIGVNIAGEECVDSICKSVKITCPDCNIEGSLEVQSQTAHDGPCNGFNIIPNITTNTGTPLDYTWTLYDATGNSLGNIGNGTGSPVTLSYLMPTNDTYMVCLEVRSTSTYGDICATRICKTIENNCPPCDVTPDFKFTVSKCDAIFNNLTVASSTNVQYLWDFGDGNTSTEVNPIHGYATNGTYHVTLTASYTNGAEVCTATFGPRKVEVLNCIRSESLKEELNILQVYPNPNKGIFTLKIDKVCESCKIEIFNPSGQLIYESKLIKSNEFEVDISDKSNGIYLVKLIDGAEEKIKRVIINR